jgi:tellurite resistance protein TerC
MLKQLVVTTLRQAWRLIVIVVGFTVLLVGIALLVLPGPAFVVIPIGLAILATEFVWARTLLRRIRRETDRIVAVVRGKGEDGTSAAE